MRMTKKANGLSVDAVLLTLVKLVTTMLSLIVTRLLSEHLSISDYGTYSQILLVVSTVSSLTMLGLMDGMNYFYSSEKDEQKRNAYVATILAFQCTVGAVAGCIVLFLSKPLCIYFNNPQIKGLVIFAAVLPILQNLVSVFQILLVAVGKAKLLAIRNLIVSLFRLATVFILVLFVRNVAVILVTSVILDIAQVAVFWWVIEKSNCRIRFSKADIHLLGKICRYCAPMALFVMTNSLNKDLDKYLISMMTNTETLALYANASKQLPFDIVMTSFCTVLVPYITKYLSEKKSDIAARMYRLFLEISYISTGILCGAALVASPQLMKLLYSDKYMGGLSVFCIYILVDLFRFTNVTLVLSAAGKTKRLMFLGLGALVFNALSNIVLYRWIGMIGPAVATLVTTLIMGMLMLFMGARVMETNITKFFDLKYVCVFIIEGVVTYFILSTLRRHLQLQSVHYFIILMIVAGLYGIVMLILNGKRLLGALKKVNCVDLI